MISKEVNDLLLEILEKNLSSYFKDQLTFSFYTKVDNDLYEEFRKVEYTSFREELKYSEAELMKRISNPSSLFLIIRHLNEVLALILGYEYEKNPNYFFLDTIVVTQQKKGIGTILLNCLTIWINKRNLKGIILFTEEFNQKGENLINFYLKNDFQIILKEDSNITMIKDV